MLTVSYRQYAAMEKLADEQFRLHAVEQVRAKVTPLPTVPQARQIVDYVVTLGMSWQIEGETELHRLIDLVLRIGPGFETRPEYARIVDILSGQGPGWQRINRVQMMLDGVDPAQREAAFEAEIAAHV